MVSLLVSSPRARQRQIGSIPGRGTGKELALVRLGPVLVSGSREGTGSSASGCHTGLRPWGRDSECEELVKKRNTELETLEHQTLHALCLILIVQMFFPNDSSCQPSPGVGRTSLLPQRSLPVVHQLLRWFRPFCRSQEWMS